MSFIKKKVLTSKNRRLLWGILLVLLCFYVFFGYNYKLVYCYGDSMLPTYANGDMLITKRISGNYTPNRFDVVVIKDSREAEFITKRILGLPGEKLKMVEGEIYIDDKPILDPLYKSDRYCNEEIYKIPSNCVWVIGDNREESLYGIFLIKEVEGLVW